MKKILTVINQYDPLNSGAENIAKYIVEDTNNGRFSNDVLTVASERIEKIAERELPYKEKKNGLYNIYRFKMARLFGKEKNGFFFQYITFLKYIYHILKIGKNYDMIHAHTYYAPAAAAIIAGKILGKPVIVTGHSRLTELEREVRETNRPGFFFTILKKSDFYISISKKIKQEAVKLCNIPEEKNILIYNGIDTSRFFPCKNCQEKKELRSKLNLPLEQTVIVYHGRLNNHSKNISLLLSAVSNVLNKKKLSFFLVLIGEGPEKNKFIHFCNNSGIEKNVCFAGFQENIHEYLKAADFHCLPSNFEGLPLALLEAMSTGLLCIASNIPGNTDVIEDGVNGILFNPESEESLISKLTEALKNQGSEQMLHMRKMARQTLKKHFSLDGMMENYKKLFADIK